MTLDVPDLLARLGIDYQRVGSKLLANCPSHADSTRRWMIRDQAGDADHGRHRCLSCGYGGTAVGLVMTRLRLEYGPARQWLESSERAGRLALKVEVMERWGARRALAVPEDVLMADWLDWPERHRDYLMARGVSRDQALRWGLGFIEGASRRPQLAQRIFFPVPHPTVAARLAGWTARLVVADPNRPKYLTSSLAEGTDRTVVLGEAYWGAERGDVFVCEGPFDALALDRWGLKVATLEGSYLAPEVARKLSTFGRMILCTDPDRAGNRAAAQLFALRRHMPVERVELPEGRDVADLAVQAPGELDARIRQAVRR